MIWISLARFKIQLAALDHYSRALNLKAAAAAFVGFSLLFYLLLLLFLFLSFLSPSVYSAWIFDAVQQRESCAQSLQLFSFFFFLLFSRLVVRRHINILSPLPPPLCQHCRLVESSSLQLSFLVQQKIHVIWCVCVLFFQMQFPFSFIEPSSRGKRGGWGEGCRRAERKNEDKVVLLTAEFYAFKLRFKFCVSLSPLILSLPLFLLFQFFIQPRSPLSFVKRSTVCRAN